MVALLTVLIASSASAKDPCSKIKPHTDSFGVTTRGMLQYVGIGGYLAVSLVDKDGTVELLTMYVMPGSIDEVVPKGTPGQIALADGTVVTLVTSADAAPVTNANTAANIFTQWQLPYVVDAKTLATLSTSPISAVKSTILNQDVSFEIPEKKGARLQTAAGCLAP